MTSSRLGYLYSLIDEGHKNKEKKNMDINNKKVRLSNFPIGNPIFFEVLFISLWLCVCLWFSPFFCFLSAQPQFQFLPFHIIMQILIWLCCEFPLPSIEWSTGKILSTLLFFAECMWYYRPFCGAILVHSATLLHRPNASYQNAVGKDAWGAQNAAEQNNKNQCAKSLQLKRELTWASVQSNKRQWMKTWRKHQ